MEHKIINFSEINGHPSGRLDASYWVGKSQGKKAYAKKDKGVLVENDVTGKAMLFENEAQEYNDTKKEIQELTEKIAPIANKIK